MMMVVGLGKVLVVVSLIFEGVTFIMPHNVSWQTAFFDIKCAKQASEASAAIPKIATLNPNFLT